MKIEPGKVVTLSYDICDDKGEIVESSDISGSISFLHGKQSIIPGLNAKLEGMGEGDEGTFDFPPEEAFGRIEDMPTKTIPRTEFPEGLEIAEGARFEAGMPGGQTIVLEVVKPNEDPVEVRMIHPLAGKTISMSVKILGIRDATGAEKDAGRAISKPPPPPPKK
jgi:FKBP-type peptidyl-prolyl cis-trans isomerase SlyD